MFVVREAKRNPQDTKIFQYFPIKIEYRKIREKSFSGAANLIGRYLIEEI